jgi:ParB family chromosome partitioning protein
MLKKTNSKLVDKDAIEIGKWYSKIGVVENVKAAIECGTRLKLKKDVLDHGEWLPWLEVNADVLGFGERTARLLMSAAKRKLTADLGEEEARHILREIWGNKDGQLIQQHLSNEHYTPKQYLDAARKVLGGIDLDPASCAEANAIVGAKKFYTADDDGLTKTWSGRVWLNPPYGRNAGDFIAKFISDHTAKRIKCGIILVNAHCTDTDWFQPLWDGVLCFTNHRINFYGDDERSGSTHGSVFTYFGEERALFAETFPQFGPVVRRYA